jgi:hypothetical protein
MEITRHGLDRVFPRYRYSHPAVPVWCVTPGLDGCIHRFYDTSPFSPSGRYLAGTQLPFENRLPAPGDRANIIVTDLHTGVSMAVADTCAWDTQVGAHVQWGNSDDCLLFNDMDQSNWTPYGVILNFKQAQRRKLDGTVYMISQGGQQSASPCLLRLAKTQPGYGVVAPDERIPRNVGLSDEDGIYITNVESGRCRLLASFAKIASEAFPQADRQELRHGAMYGFHVKWNPQNDRLMFVIRQQVPNETKARSSIVTMNPDGSEMRLVLHWRVWRGHHPNWCPDGRHILMNLKDSDNILRFCILHDGDQEPLILGTNLEGSGHPTLHPNSCNILTDAKSHNKRSPKVGRVPLRWINPLSNTQEILTEISSLPTKPGVAALRVDLHPAWDSNFRMVAFNASHDGTRRIYIADLNKLLHL